MTTLPDLDIARPLAVVQFPAFAFTQGNVHNFGTSIPVSDLLSYFPVPDPDRPFEGNRKVDRARAAKFGRYIGDGIGGNSIICPGLILQVNPDGIEFIVHSDLGNGSKLGMLGLLGSVIDRAVTDGQHRILGFAEEVARIRKEIDKIERRLPRMDADEQNNSRRQIRQFQNRIKAIMELLVPVQIVSIDRTTSKVLFIDVNDNSKGVRKDFVATLDQRKVTNRIAAALADTSPVLADKIEDGQGTTISSRNPNWLGMETVSAIVRIVLRGGSGRFGVQAENEVAADEVAATAKVAQFFAALGRLQDVQVGLQDVPAMREATMLGHQTTIKFLAAAWYILDLLPDSQPGDQSEFLRWIEPRMRQVPLNEEHPFWSFWQDKNVVSGGSTFIGRQGFITPTAAAMVRDWRVEIGRPVVAAA